MSPDICRVARDDRIGQHHLGANAAADGLADGWNDSAGHEDHAGDREHSGQNSAGADSRDIERRAGSSNNYGDLGKAGAGRGTADICAGDEIERGKTGGNTRHSGTCGAPASQR